MAETAVVFNIQSYCIHDGPGIRTTVFTKGCPLRCIWCQNPESQSRERELMFFAHRCAGCGRCVKACTRNAIRLEQGIAVTDRSLCRNDAGCTEVCFQNAREKVGRIMDADEVFEELLKDTLFYDQSGGGVTFSGGEPLLYPGFMEAILLRCKQSRIHTAIETSAYADIQTIKRVFQSINFAMIDVKHMDSNAHRRLTGVGNETILQNIRYIVRHFDIPVTIRVPVVPGCNDSEENICRTAQFIREELDGSIPLQLLPYHRLGETKSGGLGRKTFFTTQPPSQEQMERLKHAAEAYGIHTQIGG